VIIFILVIKIKLKNNPNGFLWNRENNRENNRGITGNYQEK
jgi:hypothetical protein